MTDKTVKKQPITWVHKGQWLIGALALMGFLYMVGKSWIKPPLPQAAASVKTTTGLCAQALRGQAGRSAELKTPNGLRYSVVAPSNYQANKQHGLLMMFPPAGFDHEMAEHYYQMTTQANSQGYVVVYSASIPLSARALRLQNEVVPQVLANWCIDPQRIVYAGHSDGGTLSTGLAVRAQAQDPAPRSIVASAAGITQEDLQQEQCPAPLNVTVLHNPKDNLFPGFGEGAVKWWGQCMQCAEPAQTEATGCTVRQCTQGKVLRHCVTPEPHVKFPAVASHMLAWLD